MSGAEDDDSRRIGPRRGPSSVSGISRRGSNESQGFTARSSDADLYELCEAILSDSTSKEDQTVVSSRRWSNDGSSIPSAEEQVDPSEVWKPVRFWFAQNLSLQHRRVAALKRGTFETTALHLVTQHKDPPIDIISALISAAPETASLPDANGWLPIHFASAKGASLDVLKLLADNFPDGLLTQDQRMRTPLHFAFFVNENNKDEDKEGMRETIDIVRFLSSPTVARIPDEKGRLPFHFAVAYGTCEPILRILYNTYPDSINAKENMGRNVLHIAMANPRKNSPEVLTFLLEHLNDTAINETDNEGTSPIQLLSSRASKLNNSNSVEEKPMKEIIIECLEIYLNAKPSSSADLLFSLQSLPEWLRGTVVVNPHVQDILNKKIAQRFPTSILLLDLYLNIIIIICFQMASRAHIDYRFTGKDLPGYTNISIIFALIGTTYFLIRKIAHFTSTMSVGTFRSWICDIANWFDIIIISLLYYYCIMMKLREAQLEKLQDFEAAQDYNFRTGVALTGALLWITGVSFLKSTMLDFAVFSKSVQDITRHLFIFMLSLLVIFVAFAEAFVIIFRKTPVCDASCIEEYNTFPHCDFRDSLLKVYTMMMGEIGDVNRYQQSMMAQFLYCCFAFLVVILLSNVLIAIVAERHSVIQNEHAEMVFWSNRLHFVAEMDAIISVMKRDNPFFGSTDHSYKEPASQNDQLSTAADSAAFNNGSNEQTRDMFRAGWNELIEFLREEPVEEDLNLIEIYLSLILRLTTVTVVIPLWLVLGLGSVGILWPPQVREWLFIQRRRSPVPRTSDVGSEDNKNSILNELDAIREYVAKTKHLQINVSNELIQMKDSLEALLQT